MITSFSAVQPHWLYGQMLLRDAVKGTAGRQWQLFSPPVWATSFSNHWLHAASALVDPAVCSCSIACRPLHGP